MSFIRSGACRRRGESEYGQWPLELWISSSSSTRRRRRLLLPSSASQPSDFEASTCNVWASKSTAGGLRQPRQLHQGHGFFKWQRLVKEVAAKLSPIGRNDLLIAPTAADRVSPSHTERPHAAADGRTDGGETRSAIHPRPRPSVCAPVSPERRLAARTPGRRGDGRRGDGRRGGRTEGRTDTCRRRRRLRCIHTHLDTYLAVGPSVRPTIRVGRVNVFWNKSLDRRRQPSC